MLLTVAWDAHSSIPQRDDWHCGMVGVEGKNADRRCAKREMLRFDHR